VRDEVGLGQNVQQRVDIWRSSDAPFEDFKLHKWEAISLSIEMQDSGLLNPFSYERSLQSLRFHLIVFNSWHRDNSDLQLTARVFSASLNIFYCVYIEVNPQANFQNAVL
jgi:hypothetical protein